MSELNQVFGDLIETSVSARMTEFKSEVDATITAKIEALDLTKLVTPRHKTIILKNSQGKKIKKIEGFFHKDFVTVLQCIQSKVHTVLIGDTGSGKSFLAEQVAEALDIPFHCTGTTSQEHKLVGYGDAKGDYVMSLLYRAVKNGGLMCLDELDSWCPNVTLLMNSLLSNGYCEFPVHGMVYAHKDFRVLACMNTTGKGATREYVGRNRLDAAFLARFTAMITIDIDEDLEMNFAENLEYTIKVIKTRKAISDLGMPYILSPRQGNSGAKLLASGMNEKIVDQVTIWRDMPDSDIKKVKNQLTK